MFLAARMIVMDYDNNPLDVWGRIRVDDDDPEHKEMWCTIHGKTYDIIKGDDGIYKLGGVKEIKGLSLAKGTSAK